MYIGFEAIARGDSHKEKDLPCQDAVLSFVVTNGGIAIVADGHGSEKHFRSDTGSKIATEVAQEAIAQFFLLQSKENKNLYNAAYLDEQLRQLERYIIVTWREKVLKSFEEFPLNEAEKTICTEQNIDLDNENDRVRLYGTTLIAAFIHKNCWFALQIGDGKCVRLDAAGTAVFPPELEDDSLAGGKTTSLCDSDASGHFRHAFGYDTILGITVASDGVSDSFIPEEYLKLHSRMLNDFTTNAKQATAGLQKSISVWSAKGSRDDVSMAGVFYKENAGLGSFFKKGKKTKTDKKEGAE
jgi:serine/threonine protein phosphatase PrpC